MNGTLLEELTAFLEARKAPLIDKRTLSDGTTEFAFEPQSDRDGVCLIRVFQLPDETCRN